VEAWQPSGNKHGTEKILKVHKGERVKTSFVLAVNDVHNIVSELRKLIKSEDFKKVGSLALEHIYMG